MLAWAPLSVDYFCIDRISCTIHSHDFASHSIAQFVCVNHRNYFHNILFQNTIVKKIFCILECCSHPNLSIEEGTHYQSETYESNTWDGEEDVRCIFAHFYHCWWGSNTTYTSTIWRWRNAFKTHRWLSFHCICIWYVDRIEDWVSSFWPVLWILHPLRHQISCSLNSTARESVGMKFTNRIGINWRYSQTNWMAGDAA